MIMSALALAAASVPADPPRDDFKKLEIIFQVANLADFITTEHCVRSGRCVEANPLIGRNPSTEKLLAIKVATGISHYFIARELAKTNPKAARIFQYGSIALVGGVAVANLRFAF